MYILFPYLSMGYMFVLLYFTIFSSIAPRAIWLLLLTNSNHILPEDNFNLIVSDCLLMYYCIIMYGQ